MIKNVVISPVQSTLKALLTKFGYPFASAVARGLRVALYGVLVGGVSWALVNYTSLNLNPAYAFAAVTFLMGLDKYLREHQAEITGEDEVG